MGRSSTSRTPGVRLERLARGVASRPILTLAIGLLGALGGGALALGLAPNAGSDTLVSSSSPSFKVTADFHSHFGDDAVIVLIRESLPNLVETKDLATLTELEACLAGQVVVPNQQLASFTPAAAGVLPPYGGYASPCGELTKRKLVQVVYGPGTFLNRAVAAVNTQMRAILAGAKQAVTNIERRAYELALGRGLDTKQARATAKAAGQIEQQQQLLLLERQYLNSGLTGAPRIDDPQFIPQIVFDQTRGVNQPKARFSYLFPTANAALVQVRLKSSLSDAQRSSAIKLIRQAVRMPMFRSAYGGKYVVTGAPVVVHDLAAQITGAITGLLIAVLLVMALTLLLVFRSRLRLLPLLVAVSATGITFGAISLAGASLTMASVAVLPVLIGLAVDYAIQFQSRVQEARLADPSDPPRAPGTAAAAVARAAVVGAPTIATAALATATGLLVLALSPVPMVRGFGLLLVVGIVVALLCALTLGSAALTLPDRDGGSVGASLRGARDIVLELGAHALTPLAVLTGRPMRTLVRGARGVRGARRVLVQVTSRPGLVLTIAAALAVMGWVADTQTAVQSDITKLVPSSLPALRDLHALEAVTGVSGELDVTVKADDVTKPQIVAWMGDYKRQLLAHFGYLETNGCARATLCPALSLPDLFSSGTQAGQSQSPPLTQASVRALLAAVPPDFSQAVITADYREATLAFGIRLMPLSRQQQVIDYMRSRLHPPPGVTAGLAGLPVLAAQANAALSSSARRLLSTLAALIAVGLALLLVFRRAERVLVPLIPIALATGWSALILFVIGIPLNPMSATLGTLVIAISTEFSVLLSERFRQERSAGHELPEALARTYRSTGAAVLASGVTAIAGFGVLVHSNINMLRDFGFVTLIDLTVSLAGVLLVLPAVLVLAQRGGVAERAGEAARRIGAGKPWLRRRPRAAAG